MTSSVLRLKGHVIEAITVDFWDSLANDQGYEARQHARADAAFAWLQTRRYSVDRDAIRTAFDHFSEFWRSQWKDNNLTPGPLDCVAFILSELNLRLSPRLVDGLADAIERVILNRPPVLVEGAVEALTAIHRYVPLGIVCDTGVSGPKMLNQLLHTWGINYLFEAKAYSLEVGVSKPKPAIFQRALDRLGIPPEKTLHIGDLEHTDVLGAKRLGMRAIRFDGVKAPDKRSAKSKADLVVTSWQEILDALGIEE